MYTVDNLDKLRKLDQFPPCSPGAPLPRVFADEHSALLLYYCESNDSERCKILPDGKKNSAAIAKVEFNAVEIYMFGVPNDESIFYHPLFSRGLEAYEAYVVDNSSWIRSIETMYNCPDEVSNKDHLLLTTSQHFILTFHDTTFECIAEDYSCDIIVGERTQMMLRCIDEWLT